MLVSLATLPLADPPPELVLPPFLVLLYSGMLGAMVGSFCNVAIYRIPRRCRSVSQPARSFCPRCKKGIAWYDNLPVISWLLLGARCRNCKQPISIRYPLVEAVVAALWVLVAWRLMPEAAAFDEIPWLRMLLLQGLASVLVVVSMIDFDWKIIPDRIDIPGIFLAPLVATFVPGFVEPLDAVGELWGIADVRLLRLFGSLAGAAAGAGSLYLVARVGAWVFRREAMGLGDVKLMGMLGGLLGWQHVLLAIVMACFLGTVLGLFVKLLRDSSQLPFGPPLCLASFWLLLFPGETRAALGALWELRRTDPLMVNLASLGLCALLLLVFAILRRGKQNG